MNWRGSGGAPRDSLVDMFLPVLLSLGLPLLASAKPNIVFMLADDLGWSDVGYHDSEIRTPHIDSLVADGVELDRYYTFPLCSPSRAAFLTGRSPIRLGVHMPIGPTGGMPVDEHLLPETLKAAGYQTFLSGKWHLGLERVAWHPYRRGFDRTFGHLGPSVDYFTHIWLGGLDWYRDGRVVREDGYATSLIAGDAVARITTRDKSRPMFLYVAFNAPHTPLQVPREYTDRYGSIVDEGRRTYAAMVSAMDDGVGQILAALDDQGIAENTIVVWASDNGGGRNVGASNLPFRGSKGNAYEGGIRVPAVLRWPGVLSGGQRFSQMITAMDWFPTLAAAVGVQPRNSRAFDGVDMWTALKEGERVPRPPTILGVEGNYAVFREDWKLVRFTQRATGRTGTSLFRIREDPLEERDLVDTLPDVKEELVGILNALPKAPSVGSDDIPGPRRGARGGARKDAKGPVGARRTNPAVFRGEPRETRKPWLETAIRD